MKRSGSTLTVLLLAWGLTPAQSQSNPPKPLAKAVPEFQIESTQEYLLPDHKIIMNWVANPGIPDPPTPPPRKSVEEWEALRASPQWQARMAKQRAVQTFFVTATVYDHQRTFLTWHGNGRNSGTFAAWSNIDFTHFTAMGGFEAQGVRYAILLVVRNVDTARWREFVKRHGREYQAPVAPALPTGTPSFQIVEGNADELPGVTMMNELHELYKTEGLQLALNEKRRERDRLERQAFLKAHPQTVPDTVIHFWPGKGSRYYQGPPEPNEEKR